MEIPFVGGAYEGRSKSLNAQRSINLIPAIDNQDAKTILSMEGTPGLTEFSDTTTEAEFRGMHVLGSYLYVVIGAVVYRVSTNGTAVYMGVLTTLTGYVGMADNGTEVLITDGTAYGHLITGGSLVNIVSAGFPAASDCIFFDGYFIVTVKDTGKFQISSQYDGTTWAALDYATAESATDNLVGVASTKKNVWVFGELTVEVYYNSGNADFPFARVPGAVNDIGCGSVRSITEIKDNIFWLTNTRLIAKTSGYGFEIISPPGLAYQLSQYTTISDAIGFSYTLEGNSFYVINFPTHDKTWVYDVQTSFWHEWQSLDSEGTAGQFRGVAGTVFNNVALVGERDTGKIYSLSKSVYTDAGLNIRRIRRAMIVNKEAVNVIHNKIEIEFEAGVGLNVAAGVDGYDPQAVLKYSDNGGNTWSTGRSVSIGKYQEYTTRAIWRRLGKSRDRIYELTVESPVKIVIIASYADLKAARV